MHIGPKSLFTLTLLVLAGVASPVAAEGFLRERIKERIAEKLQNAPAPEVTTSATQKITASGDYTFSIQHDGLTRHYTVHVPKHYNPDNALPLLFAFHGGGGDMEYMARDEHYGLVAKADKTGFIVVFPNGYSKFQSGKLATWNAGECCGDARDQKIDDVGFVRAMVKNITSQMKIDRNRIFAIGMSNGGMMAHRLACEMPDVFSGVASVTGTDSTQSCAPAKPVSVLHIHAQNDTHVLFNGGAGEGAFRDESKVANFISVPETIARWVKRNSCSPQPERVLTVKGAYCDLYSNCASGTQVKLCVTETGGHSWPGGSTPGGVNSKKKEPTSKAINANDVIWSFFMDVTRCNTGIGFFD